MAQIVVMPQLGNTVESCLVTGWLVGVGDAVEPATPLCEIETDKSAMEVPAGAAGTVLALLAAEGDDVPVKAPIAIVGEPGEDVSGLAPDGPADAASSQGPVDSPQPAPTAAAPAPAAPSDASPAPREASATGIAPNAAAADAAAASPGDSPVSPRARALAAARGVAATSLTGSGPKGRVIERDVRSALAAGPGLTVGAKAAANGFVPAMTGSGIGGRVTRADLADANAQTAQTAPGGPAAVAASATTGDFPGPSTDTPLKGVRKLVAERMMESLAASAQLTYSLTAPAAGLLALRARFKASDPELGLDKITVGDLVGYAAVKTLARHPGLNSHLSDGLWRRFDHVHLGMAVDTPRGLLVPTLRNASSLGLREFSDASKVLASQAIGGSINPDLLAGATFTVSNLGAFGIESFTPLLNLPQVAILGVDAITPRAAIGPDGEIAVEQRVGLSLTADHRVIDGADAARYLRDLARAIADIDLTILA
ncbi:MAG: 2-oxo acid dehydrogenase subunit E2 [Propionibacteriaceae bacterium]|jgi:pyruvate dehydrogenase E2 component (dihydrolipoamide acetyltransferase)|nr:2-oxo acid dehydrogenase subunit E2 [Propionibacteriaceae bacterium]